MYHFRLILFGSASSPFMLYATLHCLLTQCGSTISKDILQNLYVNNILSGCSTEEESVVFCNESRTILSEANFKLRSWVSNSKQLCDSAKKDHCNNYREVYSTNATQHTYHRDINKNSEPIYEKYT